jgi:pimeloyl-ACP methyl ester carboxylesterase
MLRLSTVVLQHCVTTCAHGGAFPEDPMSRLGLAAFAALSLLLLTTPAQAASTCEPDAPQASGSIYRICMPAADQYNGMLVVWAHGFQDAGTPVQIPDDQLCTSGFCIPDLVNALGFGFATNSYRKTGLAVLQGEDDILDLVTRYSAEKGKPSKVFLVGASEGGLITTLALEQHSDVFSAGLAACGPIGDFPFQLAYFGDARAAFEVFFHGVIPGDPFHPSAALATSWASYYEHVVEPIVFNPANRSRLDQWVRVARLPYEPTDYLGSLRVSVRDVLRYSVVNLEDAAATLGGFPFDNQTRVYRGSTNDGVLNLLVPRVSADPAAVAAMQSYQTTGLLARPLITIHTLRDQQVPFVHEQLYALKTYASGNLRTHHFPVAIDRFEHCNFTAQELLNGFLGMLFMDAVVPR